MSINKLISIHDAVYNAFQDTGVDVATMTPVFMRWAIYAEKQIGSIYGWKKLNAVLTGKGCRVSLPTDCMSIQRVVFGDFGCNCDSLMDSCGLWAAQNWAIQNLDNGPFIQNGGDMFLMIDLDPSQPQSISWGLCGNPYEIQDNSLVYGRSVDKQKVTIRYLGYEKDCDGFLLINENHIEALTSYIKWQYANLTRYTPSKMDIWDVTNNKKEWVEQRNMVRAEDSNISPEEQRYIASMLSDPWCGIGFPPVITGNNVYFNAFDRLA